MIEIIQAETEEQIEAARGLFREYEAWFGMNLCFQNFDEMHWRDYAPSIVIILLCQMRRHMGCSTSVVTSPAIAAPCVTSLFTDAAAIT